MYIYTATFFIWHIDRLSCFSFELSQHWWNRENDFSVVFCRRNHLKWIQQQAFLELWSPRSQISKFSFMAFVVIQPFSEVQHMTLWKVGRRPPESCSEDISPWPSKDAESDRWFINRPNSSLLLSMVIFSSNEYVKYLFV